MLGLQKLDTKYIPHLKMLIRIKNFAGIMCGKSVEALFIVG